LSQQINIYNERNFRGIRNGKLTIKYK